MGHNVEVHPDRPSIGEPLTLALSFLTLSPGSVGGGETYARALCSGLASTPGVRATSYVSAEAKGWTAELPEVVVSEVQGGARHLDRARTLVQTQAQRDRLFREWAAADVVHYPVTVFAPWPQRRPGSPKIVQTVFDLQHLELPHLFSPLERAYRWVLYEKAARHADVIVTISEFSRQAIVDRLGIDPGRVVVAHLGIDQDFTPNLGEREPFLLYPAWGAAHKNHSRLVEAVALVRQTRPEMRLVLTGGGLASLGDLPEWVDVRGFVSRQELRDLYRRAAALTFPSLYEGFGLPPLEAMASGCPVVSSTAGSLPEVCGEAAEFVDATDPTAIASGIVAALTRSEQLTDLGLQQASRFTWEACVDAHLRAYAQATGS